MQTTVEKLFYTTYHSKCNAIVSYILLGKFEELEMKTKQLTIVTCTTDPHF